MKAMNPHVAGAERSAPCLEEIDVAIASLQALRARLVSAYGAPVRAAYQTAGERPDGRTVGGQFGPRNRDAVGSGIKAQIRRSLGDPENPLVGELVREALKMYRATLRDLPDDGPQVRALVAAHARHAILATYYTNAAAAAGLATAEGLALSTKAGFHDGLAARLSTTAFDRAVKRAATRPRGPNPILAAIEAAASSGSGGDR